MSNAYDEGLQDIVIRAAEKLNLKEKIRPDGARIVHKLSLCFHFRSFISIAIITYFRHILLRIRTCV